MKGAAPGHLSPWRLLHALERRALRDRQAGTIATHGPSQTQWEMRAGAIDDAVSTRRIEAANAKRYRKAIRWASLFDCARQRDDGTIALRSPYAQSRIPSGPKCEARSRIIPTLNADGEPDGSYTDTRNLGLICGCKGAPMYPRKSKRARATRTAFHMTLSDANRHIGLDDVRSQVRRAIDLLRVTRI